MGKCAVQKLQAAVSGCHVITDVIVSAVTCVRMQAPGSDRAYHHYHGTTLRAMWKQQRPFWQQQRQVCAKAAAHGIRAPVLARMRPVCCVGHLHFDRGPHSGNSPPES